MENDFHSLLQCFLKYDLADLEDFSAGRARMVVPIIPETQILSLLRVVEQRFCSEAVLLHLESPLIVVGDLHGHLPDVIRIIINHGLPIMVKYLFLGDIVDRGEFSTETCIFIFLLKALYPDNVFLIRGNHEFRKMCTSCGFFNEMTTQYKIPNLIEHFLVAFNQMPIAAIIDNQHLCLHGGIGPNVFSILQISGLQRPILDFDNEILNTILWSDPDPEIEGFGESPRGMGYRFGEKVLCSFLDGVKMKTLIRAHECVQTGIQTMFNERLYVVFSASNYCGAQGNESGVLVFHNSGKMEPVRYRSMGYILRMNALFFKAPICLNKSNIPTIPKMDSSNAVSELTKKKAGIGISFPSVPIPSCGSHNNFFNHHQHMTSSSTHKALSPPLIRPMKKATVTNSPKISNTKESGGVAVPMRRNNFR